MTPVIMLFGRTYSNPDFSGGSQYVQGIPRPAILIQLLYQPLSLIQISVAKFKILDLEHSQYLS